MNTVVTLNCAGGTIRLTIPPARHREFLAKLETGGAELTRMTRQAIAMLDEAKA